MIGVFDSGVGGLSVLKELVNMFPQESIVYYADNANCPYGEKSAEEVSQLCDDVVKILLSEGCTLIVVACNTATAAAIDYLREKYPDIPFVGMEPAIKPAAKLTKTGVVGVLATEGTFKGRLYQQTSQKYASHVKVVVQPGWGLVDLVEHDKIETAAADALLRKYIEPMMAAKVDQLVLGCTHYPFLSSAINQITGGVINLINPAEAVSKQVDRLLAKFNLRDSKEVPSYKFMASGNEVTLLEMVERVLPEFQKQHLKRHP
ncbi:glutamate racemase [Limibacter armeniacum]|uniref:glutamate racemase n=1 Tax=Limibacter armeniacum TaxID=466084 RepID=UPI002FE53FB5